MKMRDYEYAPAEREKDGPYGRDASACLLFSFARESESVLFARGPRARVRGWAEASTVDVALVDVVKVDVAASSPLSSARSRVYEKIPPRLTPKSPPPPSPLASLSRLNLSMAASYLRNSSASSSASS